MGHVHKIGDEYYIEFYARGLLYQQKAGQNKARAEKLLQGIEEKIERGEMGTVIRDVDVDVFLQSFRKEYKDSHPPRTWKHYQESLLHFESFLKQYKPLVQRLSQITPAVIEEYRVCLLKPAAGIKPEAINLNLILIRDALDYGIKLGYINDNPTVHTLFVEMPCLKDVPAFSDSEISTLLSHSGNDLKILVNLLVKTGLRFEEALCLEWRNIDFDQICLHVKRKCGSYHWTRQVSMERDIHKKFKKVSQTEGLVLETLLGHPMQMKEIQTDFKQALKQSGLSRDLTFVSLRHTFAQRLLVQGITFVKLARLLGLDDMAQIVIYLPFRKNFSNIS